LYTMGYNAPEDAILPQNWDWSKPAKLDEALRTLTSALRPWTIDFHVAQNDATVHGSGTHDKTGRHCQVNDPNGKLNIPYHAAFWLRDQDGKLTHQFQHICWDGCMFPNAVMMQPQNWNKILSAMISVRDGNGWNQDEDQLSPRGPLRARLFKPTVRKKPKVKRLAKRDKPRAKRALPKGARSSDPRRVASRKNKKRKRS